MNEFRSGTHPHVVAHRGGLGLRPENTMAAFRHAHTLGIRTMELDIHLTADSVLVVSHDASLDRATNGRGPIAGYTRNELRAFDAGFHFRDAEGKQPFRGTGIQIPSFEEVVTELADATFIVELKPKGPAIARAIRAEVDRLGLHERVCVAGFDEPTLAMFRALPGRRVHTSGGQAAITAFWVASRVGADRFRRAPFDMIQAPPRAGRLTVIDARFLAAAERARIEVHAWTINDPAEAARLLALGVDAVITDQPDQMLRLNKPDR